MPHNASLTDRLIDVRAAITGATRNQVAPAITAFVAASTAADRRALIGGLAAPAAPWPTAHAQPLVPEHVRGGFLPAANHMAQQELEAGVFDAACGAINQLHRGGPVARPW